MGHATITAGTAGNQEPRTGAHYHVHSHIGSGYLCECDAHYPMTARERDAALRAERDAWRDYCADAIPSDTGQPTAAYRITGSVRAGWFTITDTLATSWTRYVDAWTCTDPECYAVDTDA